MEDNVYNETYLPFEKRKNLGFQYKDYVLKKTLSKRLFNNKTMSGFLGYVNDMMYETIESVKKIKTFFNYIVDKNDRRIY